MAAATAPTGCADIMPSTFCIMPPMPPSRISDSPFMASPSLLPISLLAQAQRGGRLGGFASDLRARRFAPGEHLGPADLVLGRGVSPPPKFMLPARKLPSFCIDCFHASISRSAQCADSRMESKDLLKRWAAFSAAAPLRPWGG